jgi:hypothetical protein
MDCDEGAENRQPEACRSLSIQLNTSAGDAAVARINSRMCHTANHNGKQKPASKMLEIAIPSYYFDFRDRN